MRRGLKGRILKKSKKVSVVSQVILQGWAPCLLKVKKGPLKLTRT